MKQFLLTAGLHQRFYMITALIVALFILAYPYPIFLLPAQIIFGSLVLITLIDLTQLFVNGSATAIRILPEKFSNGDFNRISLEISNRFSFPVYIEIFDELPIQFQARNKQFNLSVMAMQSTIYSYELRPTERGEYRFAAINLFVSSKLKLAQRKIVVPAEQTIPVYPSFINMHKYELIAFSSQPDRSGNKILKRMGHSREFEQINYYVIGNDIRTINWKATARHNELMVNQYQDETSQNIYSLIDMSRNMQLPFNGLTLLDYAINSALVISNIAVKKYDKAGLLTFSNHMGSYVPPAAQIRQIQKIMDALYKQTTDFREANFEMLYVQVSHLIHGRSLLFLYTNFQEIAQMRRQLKYLRSLNKFHLLVVIIFENYELTEFTLKKSKRSEEIYQKAIAAQFVLEKQQIIKELNHNGIITILTRPENLSIDTLNKYLELKSLGLI